MNQNVKSSVPNKLVDQNGTVYDSIRKLAKTIHVKRERISKAINDKGSFEHNGIIYSIYGTGKIDPNENVKVVTVEKPREDEKEYQEFLRAHSHSRFISSNHSQQRKDIVMLLHCSVMHTLRKL